MKNPKNEFRAKIAALIFFFMLLLYLEGLAHLFSGPKTRLERILSVLEQDANLFWRQRAHLNTIFEDVKVQTNSLGLRHAAVSREPAEGVYRIVCLGASPTFGWGVNREYIYSSQLTQLLNKDLGHQEGFEVINAGMIGYSSYQGLKFFQNVILQFSPDLIIVPYVLNDVDKHRFYKSNGMKDKDLRKSNEIFVSVDNLISRSAIVRLLRRAVIKTGTLAVSYYGASGKNVFIETRRVSSGEYRENLKSIIQSARDNNIDVLLLKLPVNLPAAGYVSEDSCIRANNYIDEALSYAQKENYEEAVQALNKAVVANPYSSKAFYYLGKYHARLKNLNDAHEAFQEAVKMELYECERLGKQYNQIMQEVAEQENVPLIDIVRAFDEYRRNNTADLFLDVKNDTIHPSRIGHTVIAREIYKEIADKFSSD